MLAGGAHTGTVGYGRRRASLGLVPPRLEADRVMLKLQWRSITVSTALRQAVAGLAGGGCDRTRRPAGGGQGIRARRASRGGHTLGRGARERRSPLPGVPQKPAHTGQPLAIVAAGRLRVLASRRQNAPADHRPKITARPSPPTNKHPHRGCGHSNAFHAVPGQSYPQSVDGCGVNHSRVTMQRRFLHANQGPGCEARATVGPRQTRVHALAATPEG